MGAAGSGAEGVHGWAGERDGGAGKAAEGEPGADAGGGGERRDFLTARRFVDKRIGKAEGPSCPAHEDDARRRLQIRHLNPQPNPKP